MNTPSVLLLEHRSGDLQGAQLPWPDLTVYTRARAGAAAALKTRPDVILLSMRQSERNGLQIARVLRKRLGDRPVIVVYGKPTGALRRALARREPLRRRWGVDRFLAATPSASRLAELVTKLLEERHRGAGAVTIPQPPTPTEAVVVPPKPGLTFIIRKEMHQAVREATGRAAAPRAEKPTSVVTRLFDSIRSFFRRAA